ncbi:MAG: helix-turn-helix transcriptional regulator [Bdellovibrionales bacterium]|nr:helix-turn-helix transcriptional regulator [Bdellovibrionales bacterium]
MAEVPPRFGVGTLLLLLVLVLLAPLIIVLIVGMVLYELTPWRRAAVFRFETKILQVLARNGEMAGMELRETANAELGARFGLGTFYSSMSRLEKGDLVESRLAKEMRGAGEDAFERTVAYYRLTKGGRRERTKRTTIRETLSALPGRLKPAPCPA